MSRSLTVQWTCDVPACGTMLWTTLTDGIAEALRDLPPGWRKHPITGADQCEKHR